MKTLAHYLPTQTPNELNASSGISSLRSKPRGIYGAPKSDTRSFKLLTDEAAAEMSRGTIPNLEQVCRDLYHTLLIHHTPYTALQFIPVLKKLTALHREEAEQFLKNPTTNHVLMQNDWLKVVLIHWKPGKVSSIHGHPSGGCVFKVLQGCLEEKRYSPDDSQQRLIGVSTLQSGGMAYIDDGMAYHAVGNPFGSSAISLHVYTPGGNRK